MQFRFYGISKWTGELVGDATAVHDFDSWAKSRGIDVSGLHPFGERPVPPDVEVYYSHAPCYFTEEKVAIFFD